jgi:hypothetical protein
MANKSRSQQTNFVNIKDRVDNTGGIFEKFARADRDTIVYKGVYSHDPEDPYWNSVKCTAKLLIKKGTRVYLTNTKCRAECATVLEITKVKSKSRFIIARSTYTQIFKYHVGKEVIPDGFSLSYEKCAKGIHFFRTLQEARKYIR